jgi:hypothetical protein
MPDKNPVIRVTIRIIKISFGFSRMPGKDAKAGVHDHIQPVR